MEIPNNCGVTDLIYTDVVGQISDRIGFPLRDFQIADTAFQSIQVFVIHLLHQQGFSRLPGYLVATFYRRAIGFLVDP